MMSACIEQAAHDRIISDSDEYPSNRVRGMMATTRASGNNNVGLELDLSSNTAHSTHAAMMTDVTSHPTELISGDVELSTTAVIIPALNEADNLAVLLPHLSVLDLGQIIVADNGSTDATAAVARDHGAVVASAPKRGYGAACQAGLTRLEPEIDVVVFLDADQSDDPELLPRLVEPIQSGVMDMVLTARVKRLRSPGSMTLPQAFGTRFAVLLIRLGWRHRYRDLGPFRAIRRDCLDQINMRDQAFGWTVEMQIRAIEEKLRIREFEAPYYRRIGRGKISGTVKGVFLAGYWILRTCGALYLTKPKRRRSRGQTGQIAPQIRTPHGSGEPQNDDASQRVNHS